MATLDDYQFSYRGLTWGINTVYNLIRVDGLDDLNVRVGDRDFPRQQGQISGQHLAGHRLITFDMEVGSGIGSDAATTAPEFQDLVSTLSTDQGSRDGTLADDDWDKLIWKEPGFDELFVRARPVRRRAHRQHDTEWGHRPITFQLRCADPRKYKNEVTEVIRQSGNFTVNYEGDARAYPKVFIEHTTGTVTRLRNLTTGVDLYIDRAETDVDYTINLDYYVRGVNLPIVTDHTSTDSIYGKWRLPREPFYLIPGDNDLNTYVSDTVDISWNDTFL